MTRKQCFVIMPFSDAQDPANNKWDDLFTNYIQPAVEEADLGYECYRSVDAHGSFMYDIVNRLAGAEVVIAVLTELRPNVMYELGIRNVLRRKTIMLVEKNFNIPSDLSAFIALRYSTKTKREGDELRKTIQTRLRLLDDKEPESDNPVADHLRSRALQVVKEWYEKENPSVSMTRLNEIVPSYVFELEPVMSEVRFYFEKGATPKARQRRPSSIRRRPRGEAAREVSLAALNRGQELKENHDHEEALKHFDQTIQLEPENAAAWSSRALVLVQLERFQEAEESARRVVDLQPTSADSWNSLGKALFLLKKFDEAAKACTKAVELDPQSAVYANNAGVALESNERASVALQYYEQALELNPRFEHALYNRGKLLQKLGRQAEGEDSIRQALQINPRIGEEVDTQLRGVATGMDAEVSGVKDHTESM